MQPGLAALIQPHPVTELHLHEAFVKHGRSEAVAELFALPLTTSFDGLLGAWPDVVDVHVPDVADVAGVADEASTIHASPHDARTLYASGMGLMFDDVDRYAPALVPWLDAIRSDLGLSTLTQQRCLIYATPSGGGTAPHFDQNVNFVLQLHGTKTWWLAPNAHVELPLSRHTMGLEADPELQSYATLPLPTELPEDKREIELVPGSVLFVPRGTWHATRATADSLQLNFTFSAPTWIDLLTAALRSRLALSPTWRETATPATAARFEALLRELADDAKSWSAADILSATEG